MKDETRTQPEPTGEQAPVSPAERRPIGEMIVATPDTLAGSARVAGTRIPVYMILDALAYGGSIQSVVDKQYSQLTTEQVKVAIEWAAAQIEAKTRAVSEEPRFYGNCNGRACGNLTAIDIVRSQLAEARASSDRLREALRKLRSVGTRMSNLLFNLGQDTKQQHAATMRDLQKEWDAEIAALEECK